MERRLLTSSLRLVLGGFLGTLLFAWATPAAAESAPIGIGLVPGLRLGYFSASVKNAIMPSASGSGLSLEPHLDGVLVLPGDKVALVASAGYILQSIDDPTGYSNASFGFDALTLQGGVQLAVGSALFLEVDAAVLAGDVQHPDGAEFAWGYRFMGGAMLTMFRSSGFGTAFGAKLSYTSSPATDIHDAGVPGQVFSSVGIVFDIVFTLNPEG